MSKSDGPWSGGHPPERPRRRLRRGFLVWIALLLAAGTAFLTLNRLFPGQLSGDDRAEVLRLFGLLALVSSGLVAAERVDLGEKIRHIALWVAIFALGIVGYGFRGEIAAVGLRVRQTLIPASAVTTSSRSMVVARSDDGDFYLTGEVDGTPVRFLIDTGSSDIVLSPADAKRLGLGVASSAFSSPSETANGVGYGAPVTLRRLVVGPIELRDIRAVVNRADMSSSLLGMAFLKRLDSFEARGDRLFLRGRG